MKKNRNCVQTRTLPADRNYNFAAKIANKYLYSTVSLAPVIFRYVQIKNNAGKRKNSRIIINKWLNNYIRLAVNRSWFITNIYEKKQLAVSNITRLFFTISNESNLTGSSRYNRKLFQFFKSHLVQFNNLNKKTGNMFIPEIRETQRKAESYAKLFEFAIQRLDLAGSIEKATRASKKETTTVALLMQSLKTLQSRIFQKNTETARYAQRYLHWVLDAQKHSTQNLLDRFLNFGYRPVSENILAGAETGKGSYGKGPVDIQSIIIPEPSGVQKQSRALPHVLKGLSRAYVKAAGQSAFLAQGTDNIFSAATLNLYDTFPDTYNRNIPENTIGQWLFFPLKINTLSRKAPGQNSSSTTSLKVSKMETGGTVSSTRSSLYSQTRVILDRNTERASNAGYASFSEAGSEAGSAADSGPRMMVQNSRFARHRNNDITLADENREYENLTRKKYTKQKIWYGYDFILKISGQIPQGVSGISKRLSALSPVAQRYATLHTRITRNTKQIQKLEERNLRSFSRSQRIQHHESGARVASAGAQMENDTSQNLFDVDFEKAPSLRFAPAKMDSMLFRDIGGTSSRGNVRRAVPQLSNRRPAAMINRPAASVAPENPQNQTKSDITKIETTQTYKSEYIEKTERLRREQEIIERQLPKIADYVYRDLEKRLEIEKERRGLF